MKYKCKNCLSVGPDCLQQLEATSSLLLLLTIASLSSSFLVLNAVYFPQKRTK